MYSLIVSTIFPAFSMAAALANPQDIGETFTIDQILKTKILKNGPMAMARTFRKYGIEVPEIVSAAVANVAAATAAAAAAAADADSGDISERSVAANPSDSFDSLYLSPVTLGSDTLQLYLDTGSADLYESFCSSSI